MIMEKEVVKNSGEMRKGSAPGPDGCTAGHLIKLNPKYALLTDTFNLWLACGKIPDALQKCWTVLIPKSSNMDKLWDVNNWRPITIVMLRSFSRILMVRLTCACPINPKQRGFIHDSGCSENLKLYSLWLNTQKLSIKISGPCL